MRELLLTHKDILLQLEKMENKLAAHDGDIAVILITSNNCSTRRQYQGAKLVSKEKMKLIKEQASLFQVPLQ